MDIIRSLIGMFFLLFIGFLFCNNKAKLSYRTVIAAFLLQVILGGIMLYVPAGQRILEFASRGVKAVMDYSDVGAVFMFGGLVQDAPMTAAFGNYGYIFAFRVLPAVIFVTSLISILYYLRIMGLLIKILGGLFQKALQISKIESFIAVTTIFLGQNEIPAAVKPFVKQLNRNELFTAMVSGMASIAGAMLIAYAGVGVPIHYLLAASLMAIPGGILFARLLSPATEESVVTFDNLQFSETPAKTIIEALANGALTGLKIAAGVATVVMTFVAMIALLNGIVGGLANLVGYTDITIQGLLGYIFSPLAYIMGVSWPDASSVGSLIGQKLVINEFVAYTELQTMQATAVLTDPRSIAIVSFALCGFANFGSIGVIIGAFSAVAPERISLIAQLGLRALFAATLSNLMSATIAGLFLSITM
ncbi:NupC/NupG family nucleoside CNT transporter [Bartonella sp. HY761]|uniref:NupC/NupG family nucleoside CNT transporter n=1 Tax=Bartonella sp. HY761 TaxID=2979330 RepID=UPI0021E32AFF|nr:NupC/NupG family nucleoside CNT transporter [Bartonella sp. HY761]UXN07940.1 NupC/NupG family nucleoside CNT transporter [Bartonella sp. HY761]